MLKKVMKIFINCFLDLVRVLAMRNKCDLESEMKFEDVSIQMNKIQA